MNSAKLGLALLSFWVLGLGACKDKDDPDGASGSPKAISTGEKGAKFEYCGAVVCRAGRECCNASCGRCPAPGAC